MIGRVAQGKGVPPEVIKAIVGIYIHKYSRPMLGRYTYKRMHGINNQHQ